MNVVQAAVLAIIVIEVLSVLELYFLQDRPVFNGVAIFSGWEISKEVPEVHELVRYLVNWVAGVKLIVIGLLVVLTLTAPEETLLYAGIALVLAISSFFWRMFPAVYKLDRAGCIQPAGRSRLLGWMVVGLEVVLAASVLLAFVTR